MDATKKGENKMKRDKHMDVWNACRKAEYHRLTAIELLTADGYNRPEAEDMVDAEFDAMDQGDIY